MKDEKVNRYREEENEEKTTEKAADIPLNQENGEGINKDEEAEKENEEFQKLTNQYLRLMADFDNFKKRTNEERIRERKYANQSLLEKLVNLIDIFDKAININTDDEKLKNFLMGFAMINNNFKQIFEDEGVKKIIAVGEMFDPNFHHAIDTKWDETKDEGIILQELQSGYTYKDKLLRPSLVMVNQKMKGNENNE